MAKITNITHHSDNNRKWSITDMLEDVVRELSEEDHLYNSAIVVLVRDDEQTFYCGYRAANISCSQALAALEISKQQFLEEMGY